MSIPRIISLLTALTIAQPPLGLGSEEAQPSRFLRLAEAALGRQEWDSAAVLYGEALRRFPFIGDAMTHARFARALLCCARPADAMAHLEVAREIGPRLCDSPEFQAIIDDATRKYRECLEESSAWMRVMAIWVDSSDPHEEPGSLTPARSRLLDLKSADSMATPSLRQDVSLLLMEEADRRIAAGEYDDALCNVQKAEAISGESPRTLQTTLRMLALRSQLRFGSRDYDGTEADIKTAASRLPSLDTRVPRLSLHQARGLSRLSEKDAEGALRDIDAFESLDNRLRLHYFRSLALWLRGDRPGTIRAASQAAVPEEASRERASLLLLTIERWQTACDTARALAEQAEEAYADAKARETAAETDLQGWNERVGNLASQLRNERSKKEVTRRNVTSDVNTLVARGCEVNLHEVPDGTLNPGVKGGGIEYILVGPAEFVVTLGGFLELFNAAVRAEIQRACDDLRAQCQVVNSCVSEIRRLEPELASAMGSRDNAAREHARCQRQRDSAEGAWKKRRQSYQELDRDAPTVASLIEGELKAISSGPFPHDLSGLDQGLWNCTRESSQFDLLHGRKYPFFSAREGTNQEIELPPVDAIVREMLAAGNTPDGGQAPTKTVKALGIQWRPVLAAEREVRRNRSSDAALVSVFPTAGFWGGPIGNLPKTDGAAQRNRLPTGSPRDHCILQMVRCRALGRAFGASWLFPRQPSDRPAESAASSRHAGSLLHGFIMATQKNVPPSPQGSHSASGPLEERLSVNDDLVLAVSLGGVPRCLKVHGLEPKEIKVLNSRFPSEDLWIFGPRRGGLGTEFAAIRCSPDGRIVDMIESHRPILDFEESLSGSLLVCAGKRLLRVDGDDQQSELCLDGSKQPLEVNSVATSPRGDIVASSAAGIVVVLRDDGQGYVVGGPTDQVECSWNALWARSRKDAEAEVLPIPDWLARKIFPVDQGLGPAIGDMEGWRTVAESYLQERRFGMALAVLDVLGDRSDKDERQAILHEYARHYLFAMDRIETARTLEAQRKGLEPRDGVRIAIEKSRLIPH